MYLKSNTTYKCKHDLILGKTLCFKSGCSYDTVDTVIVGLNNDVIPFSTLEELPNLGYYLEECTMDDKVNHPSHYTWLKEKCGIEVIDITRHMDFNLGNVIKYVLRAGKKAEEGYSTKEKAIEDLYKAQWYLNDKIDMLRREIDNGKKRK